MWTQNNELWLESFQIYHSSPQLSDIIVLPEALLLSNPNLPARYLRKLLNAADNTKTEQNLRLSKISYRFKGILLTILRSIVKSEGDTNLRYAFALQSSEKGDKAQ